MERLPDGTVNWKRSPGGLVTALEPLLRKLRPDLTIGFFLHIPFPPVELFMQMPWRSEIVKGLLGADLVGFHLAGGAQNFLYLARRLIGASTSRGSVGVRSRFGEVQ